MLFILSTPALALDCTGLDTDVCNAVNDIAVIIETAWGEPVVADDAPRARLRTDALYDKLLDLQDHLDTYGCVVDGIVAGKYVDRVSFQGEWAEDGGDGGTHSGVLYKNSFARGFTGSYDGDRTGTAGDEYGHYSRKQFVGNRDSDAFFAGGFASVAGRRGIYYGFSGSCPTNNNARILDYWYERELWPYYPMRMFASTPWVNPLTGVATMDQHCQDDWDAMGDGTPAIFKAAVSVSTEGIQSPVDRFRDGPDLVLAGSEDYVAPDVATWFNPAIDTAAALDVEADGVQFSWSQSGDSTAITYWGYPFDWDPYPGFGLGDCDGWTNPAAPGAAPIGGLPRTDSGRLLWYFTVCSDMVDPDALFRTICIEDTDPTDD